MKENTLEYYLGKMVGEYIITNHLPTLSTDSMQSNRVIQVNRNDTKEHDKLYKLWLNPSKNDAGYNSNWNAHLKNMKDLSKQYLPHELKMLIPKFGISLIKDMKEFKDGLAEALWDSDICSYHIEHDKIDIYETNGGWADYITLYLDIN